MANVKYRYLEQPILDKLHSSIALFCEGEAKPEQFLMKVKELLPVHRTDRDTWKQRVEGFREVSDLLMERVVAKGQLTKGAKWTEDTVRKQAKLRPLHYYHYVTGSREPAENVIEIEDYFNDPTTALVKLEDDIRALTRMYRALD